MLQGRVAAAGAPRQKLGRRPHFDTREAYRERSGLKVDGSDHATFAVTHIDAPVVATDHDAIAHCEQPAANGQLGAAEAPARDA